MDGGDELPPPQRVQPVPAMHRPGAADKSNQEGKVKMSVNLEQLQRIQDLMDEFIATKRELKDINRAIAELPEAVALKEAEAALVAATENLRLAMKNDRDYARLAVQKGDMVWHLRDLKDQLSNHIRAYHEDSGRDVVPDRAKVPHAIVATYSLEWKKPALDQPKLPLSQHFGVRQVIGEAPAARQLQIIQENK
jgi:hypothetical protein